MNEERASRGRCANPDDLEVAQQKFLFDAGRGAMQRLVELGLAKDPAGRPSSALELDARLARVSGEPVWTDEKARAWWDVHAPDLVAGPKEDGS